MKSVQPVKLKTIIGTSATYSDFPLNFSPGNFKPERDSQDYGRNLPKPQGKNSTDDNIYTYMPFKRLGFVYLPVSARTNRPCLIGFVEIPFPVQKNYYFLKFSVNTDAGKRKVGIKFDDYQAENRSDGRFLTCWIQ